MDRKALAGAAPRGHLQAPLASRCRRTTCPVIRCFQGGSTSANDSVSVVRVSLRLPYRCNFGQVLGIVGAGGALGNWDPVKAVPMQWTNGDLWAADLSIDARQASLQLEYKYVVLDRNGLVSRWTPNLNFRVDVPVQRDSNRVAGAVTVQDAWDGSCRQVDVEVLARREAGASASASAAGADPAAAAAAAADASSKTGGSGNATFASSRWSEEEQEQRVMQKGSNKALTELGKALRRHKAVMLRVQDPADEEVLLADRKLAAAASQVVAYSQALKAVERFALLPAPSSD